MTCKDCIYFKRCVVLGVELDMHHNKEAEKNCRHFKNKADFAEVVRCKECKWRGSEECAMFYECGCGEQHTWETDDDFCSYGERKEQE